MIPGMRRPSSGLSRLVICYPVGEYKHQVEYLIFQEISPMQVLEMINALPVTQKNVEELSDIIGVEKIGDQNPDRSYLETYQDRFLIVLRY